jgi:nucleoside-diphosphate-sugar epimerase
MDHLVVLGGTRFIGRATVEEFRSAGYRVTTFTRGNRPDPFADEEHVSHVTGDRTDEAAVADLAERADPDVVVDCIAYHPEEVATATRVFADVDAYVYVSSSGVYPDDSNPKREDHTRLRSCTPEQAVDDSQSTYANRKAEGDREVFRAADRGVAATSVRPCLVYGPHDYTERLDYWIDRLDRFDRVVVPGDGQHLFHRVYVRDLARAFRLVAERGTPGEAYNAADRHLDDLDTLLEVIADELDRDVEFVHALPRDLAAGDLSVDDFVCYRDYTHVLSTQKLADLGWESTPLAAAVADTVDSHFDTGVGGGKHELDRSRERAVVDHVDATRPEES